jgi:hypothetical protein
MHSNFGNKKIVELMKELVIKPFNNILKYKNEEELHAMLHSEI